MTAPLKTGLAVAASDRDRDEIEHGRREDGGQLGLDLFCGLVVSPSEPSVHPGEIFLRFDECPLTGCRYRSSLLGRPDIEDPKRPWLAGLWIHHLPVPEGAAEAGS